jgi:hypothetical protein
VDLIDEQHIPRLQVHQQPSNIPGPFQGWGRGNFAVHPHLLGQDQGHGGFSQAGGTVEQQVIQRLLAGLGRLNGNLQNLLESGLTNVFLESLGP